MSRMAVFGNEIVVINVGTSHFADSLAAQNVKVVHVAWKPPPMKPELESELVEVLRKTLF